MQCLTRVDGVRSRADRIGLRSLGRLDLFQGIGKQIDCHIIIRWRRERRTIPARYFKGGRFPQAKDRLAREEQGANVVLVQRLVEELGRELRSNVHAPGAQCLCKFRLLFQPTPQGIFAHADDVGDHALRETEFCKALDFGHHDWLCAIRWPPARWFLI